ncbi:hypothetical protein KDU71_05190 [Carboxylicivirga sediminis]|uniref:Uncharacterized protein n=1 Tax=Carboxylicivirga sediminis TaxID=2006564 RepID=A0A941F237_9BACT|nr:PilN domain-containing protein [Carboxylicivirga sediminis]MBR8534947.1 hypothetical protein [Carboxylicivirga sediminis]
MNHLLQHKLLATCSRVAAVSVCLNNKESWSYNALVLENRKGDYKVVDRKSSIQSEKELERFLPDKAPVIINIQGWGVLIKKAQFDDNGELTGQLVPNIEDFELYPYRQGKTGFVAIIRTETLQEVYLNVQKYIKDIIEISVGPMCIAPLIASLSLEGKIIAGSYVLNIEHNEITTAKPLSDESISGYKFGDDVISGPHLPLLALCISFFEARLGSDAFSKALLEEYSYKRLMFYAGWSVLVALFIGLFVNYLFFDKYNKDYNQISGQYALNENILKQLKEAESDLAVKRELVLKGGLEGQTSFAWYCDRLVELMPANLTLTQIAMHPEVSKVQKSKEIQFEENTILIVGETTDALAIHKWLSQLKREDWVKEVDLVSYSQDEADVPAKFNLKLLF